MLTIRSIFVAATVTVLAPIAAAGNAQLEPLVVTATRVPTALSDLVVPVIVIERAEIVRSGAQDLAQLLRFHAGLDIGRNGGPGQTTSVFMRGAESNHTLVLIDGVRMNPGTLGAAAIQNVRPELIERIEILKGNRSSLYGSEAIGGVINVITRTDADTERLEFSLSGGRYGTREAALAVAGGSAAASYDLAVAYGQSDGFAARVGGTDDNAHDNLSINAGAQVTAGVVQIGARLWQAEGNTEYADFFGTTVAQDYRNAVAAVSLAAPLGNRWQSRLDISHATDDIEQIQSPDLAQTQRLALDWQNTLELSPDHQLVAGLYSSSEDTRSLVFGSGFDATTDVWAAYIEDNLQRGAHNASIAARFTDHETFGNQTTWHLDYALALNDAVSLYGALASGFRAPDATDRFGFGGNPDLAPEVSRNAEGGLNWRLDPQQRMTLTAFSLTIDDLIIYDFDPVSFVGQNKNIAKARIRGIEAGYRFDGAVWQVRASAVVQDPQNEVSGAPLPRRARRSVSANVSRHFGPLQLGLDVLASSKRKDSDFSDDYNAGYVLTNFTVRRQLRRGFEILGKVENVFDTDYETARGFNTPGRGVYLTLRYRGH